MWSEYHRLTHDLLSYSALILISFYGFINFIKFVRKRSYHRLDSDENSAAEKEGNHITDEVVYV